jgi:dCMP deaminase
MNMKKKDILTFMKVLSAFEERSTCAKTKVACLLVRDGRIMSTGWNGALSGQTHCSELFDFGVEMDDRVKEILLEQHHDFQLKNEMHAEMNAIAFAAKKGVSTDGCSLVVSLATCTQCAKVIAAAGICEVFYRDDYSYDKEAHDFLRNAGVNMFKVSNIFDSNIKLEY